MSLVPLSAPASIRLISMESLKGFLEISTEDVARDERLGQVLDNVCSAIWQEWWRCPRTEFEEALEGGRTRLILSRWPIDRDSIAVFDGDDTELSGWTFEPPATLYRRSGWPCPSRATGERAEANIRVTYIAGYVLHSQVSDWMATTAVTNGQWVRVAGLPVLAECTTAGTTGASLPAWPARGSTVADGTAVWTVRDAREVPGFAQSWARIAAVAAWSARDRDPALISRSIDGAQQTFSVTLLDSADLPNHVVKSIVSRRLEAA